MSDTFSYPETPPEPDTFPQDARGILYLVAAVILAACGPAIIIATWRRAL